MRNEEAEPASRVKEREEFAAWANSLPEAALIKVYSAHRLGPSGRGGLLKGQPAHDSLGSGSKVLKYIHPPFSSQCPAAFGETRRQIRREERLSVHAVYRSALFGSGQESENNE